MSGRQDLDVIFFMLDQLSMRWLEAAWQGACPTPHIDALRRRGTTFTRCYSSNPVCCPARATLATGLHPRQHGVLQNGYRLDPQLPTMYRSHQTQGWRTGAFGKLHLRPHWEGFHQDFHPYGFDVVANTEDHRGGPWLDWVASEHPEHLDAALATCWATGVPAFGAYGPDKIDLRSRIRKLRKEWPWASPAVPDAQGRYHALPFPAELSQSEWITGQATDFIRETAGDQPLLAHISYVQPHGPWCAPEECFAAIKREHIPEPTAAAWRDDPHRPSCFGGAHETLQGDWQSPRACYFADIFHLDQQLGRIMHALEQRGRLDRSLIILLADHGDMLIDQGFTGKGEKHYDACIRVPLIVSMPGTEGGADCAELVQLEDLVPTVHAATGVDLPRAPVAGRLADTTVCPLPGHNLLPLLENSDSAWPRQTAYCESFNNLESQDRQRWARTVIKGRYRYTWYPAGGGEQLFDLTADPDEQHNLVARADMASKREELRSELLEAIVMQDHPHSLRGLFSHGVH